MNFQFEGNDEIIAMAIMNMQIKIESYIDSPTNPNWHKK